MSAAVSRVPAPPAQPRPELLARRPLVAKSSHQQAMPSPSPGRRHMRPPSPRALTPRSLPPLAAKVSDAVSGNSRCSTAASSGANTSRPGSGEADDSPWQSAGPSPRRRSAMWPTEESPMRSGGRVETATESEASCTDASSLLNRRRQVTRGGRSFFSWSFRNKGQASQKYELHEDD